VRRFQVEQNDAGVPVPSMNSVVSALRFFFTHTLDRPDLARKAVHVAHHRKIPIVLSMEEIAQVLGATRSPKHYAALSVAYGAGLRVSEVSALKVSDIDSKRMLIRVECGKGGRSRNAMLPAGLLDLLREWWKIGRREGVMHADGWLFPGSASTATSQRSTTAPHRRGGSRVTKSRRRLRRWKSRAHRLE